MISFSIIPSQFSKELLPMKALLLALREELVSLSWLKGSQGKLAMTRFNFSKSDACEENPEFSRVSHSPTFSVKIHFSMHPIPILDHLCYVHTKRI